MAESYDVFVCHASEDKLRFVEHLVSALAASGLRVWFDRFEIRPGDDFRLKMDEGLRESRCGVVVLSPRFFKYWTRAELSALFNQEAHDVDRGPRILPVRLDLTAAELTNRAPLIAARASLDWELGVPAIAQAIADTVRAQQGNHRPAPLARSPVYNVPRRRAQDFVGRDQDLQQLNALLVPGGHTALAASVEGLAGVGKTELALQMVDRLARTDRFPGGIFWFEAENSDLVPTWGGAIADSLAVSAGTMEQRAEGSIRILSTGGPALVVLDNVTSWTSATAPHPLPNGPHIAVLVTSRQRTLGGTGFKHLAIECLAPAPARELLLAVAARDLAREPGLDDLLAHLDGHTLALELAGAYLCEFPSATPSAYLALLRTGSPVEDKARTQTRYERTVRQAFDATWQHLNDATRHALRVAGWFAHEDASVALLTACGVDEDSRHALRRFHLLTESSDRWAMHRLVRDYARRAGNLEEQVSAHRAFVNGCLTRAEEIDLASGFRIYRSDRPHFDHAVDLADTILADAPADRSRFLDRIGIAAHSAGSPNRARELLERALASAIQHLGEDHPYVAPIQSDLAGVLGQLGDLLRARDLHERALASELRNLGEDDPSVSVRRANLALVLQALGELPQARDLLERALASGVKHFGEDHRAVATRRSNLALVLKDLGDLSGARDLLELALASDLQTFGETHPTVATTRSNLATVLQDLGDLPTARDLLESALASDLQNLGKDHPTVAVEMSNLANVLTNLGELPRARDLLESALASGVRTLGEDHPSLVTRRSNLAAVLAKLGDLPGARNLFEVALRSAIKNFGEDHSSVANGQLYLASVCEAEGDWATAADLCARALTSHERSLGLTHPKTALSRARLARALHRLGEWAKARAAAEQARADVQSQPIGSTYRRHVEALVAEILDA